MAENINREDLKHRLGSGSHFITKNFIPQGRVTNNNHNAPTLDRHTLPSKISSFAGTFNPGGPSQNANVNNYISDNPFDEPPTKPVNNLNISKKNLDESQFKTFDSRGELVNENANKKILQNNNISDQKTTASYIRSSGQSNNMGSNNLAAKSFNDLDSTLMYGNNNNLNNTSISNQVSIQQSKNSALNQDKKRSAGRNLIFDHGDTTHRKIESNAKDSQ